MTQEDINLCSIILNSTKGLMSPHIKVKKILNHQTVREANISSISLYNGFDLLKQHSLIEVFYAKNNHPEMMKLTPEGVRARDMEGGLLQYFKESIQSPMTSSRFSPNLLALRKGWGLSQTEMSNKFNVTQSSYGRWETGTEPNFDTIIAIADYFKISVGDLLTKELAPADVPPRWGGKEYLNQIAATATPYGAMVTAIKNIEVAMEPNQKSKHGMKLIELKNIISDQFTKSNWVELGYILGVPEKINDHTRLLKSLDFRDDDYEANILQVLNSLIEAAPTNLEKIEDYLSEHGMLLLQGKFISTAHKATTKQVITFCPEVFQIPQKPQNDRLVSVMMPFTAELRPTYQSIRNVCGSLEIECKRVDDIWENTTIIQDIFELIFISRVVIADFTGKNPNVFYEAGIAHTLGKQVIPITQSIDDVPFDLRHHRTLTYLRNQQGLEAMEQELEKRLRKLFQIEEKPNW